MRLIPSFLIACFVFSSCGEKSTSNQEATNVASDTVIHKVHMPIEPNDTAHYTQSVSYVWTVGEDTLDFRLYVQEHKSDKSVHLIFGHQKAIRLETAIQRTLACLSTIAEDFSVGQIASVYLKTPVYYYDLANNLTDLYQAKHEGKNLSFVEQQTFFKESILHESMTHFATHFQKEPSAYSLEKIHVMKKEQYHSYLPEADLSHYPDFTIGGLGLHVSFASAKSTAS